MKYRMAEVRVLTNYKLKLICNPVTGVFIGEHIMSVELREKNKIK